MHPVSPVVRRGALHGICLCRLARSPKTRLTSTEVNEARRPHTCLTTRGCELQVGLGFTATILVYNTTRYIIIVSRVAK